MCRGPLLRLAEHTTPEVKQLWKEVKAEGELITTVCRSVVCLLRLTVVLPGTEQRCTRRRGTRCADVAK